MPVLLLAQGDAEARDLLRKAIEARYGPRPPALDSLKIDFNGRTRIKVGPVMTWVPRAPSRRAAIPALLSGPDASTSRRSARSSRPVPGGESPSAVSPSVTSIPVGRAARV